MFLVILELYSLFHESTTKHLGQCRKASIQGDEGAELIGAVGAVDHDHE